MVNESQSFSKTALKAFSKNNYAISALKINKCHCEERDVGRELAATWLSAALIK